jgi:hypothetical protein
VRKMMTSMLVPVVVFLGVSRAATAASPQELKPLAVVSIAAYDQLLDSVELAGKLAGKPKLAKGLRGTVAVLTQGRGLAGLNKTRPMAIVLQADGSGLGGYACLPVDDPAALREVIEPLVEKIEDLGDGVYRVQGKGPRQVAFVKERGGRWLFVSDKRERLANTPDDPTETLAGLPGQYDVAARLNVGSLPAGEREKLLAAIDQQARKGVQQRPGEDDGEYAVRKIMTANVVAVVRALAEQLDAVTLGWSLNHDTHCASLDLAVTAEPGSDAAEAFARLPEAKTDFAGFLLPDAVLCGHVTATCPYAESGDLDDLFAAIRAKAFSDIDAKEPSADRAKLGKEIVGGILDVVQKTAASGRLDGATSLVADSGGVTFVTGRHVADGRKLDETFRKFVAALREEYPAHAEQVLKTDVGELDGVRLHTALFDVPRDTKNRDKLVQLVGERLELALGIGPQSVCLAAGRDALATLKKAIEASASAGPKSVPPMEMSISLGRFTKLVSETGGSRAKQRAGAVLTALESAGGGDHVRLVASPVENGVRLRLEFEPGVLGMIEAMHKE